MKRYAILLTLLPVLLGACTAMEPLTAYESDELVAVKHNQDTDCTLLIYRDPFGQTRHVFRKHGVFEFGLTFTLEGGIYLKERGRGEREIEAIEASRVTNHINNLLRVQKQQERKEQLSNT